MGLLKAIRRRFVLIEKDVQELRIDVGESEVEKDSVMDRLHSLEDAARSCNNRTKEGDQ